MTITSSSKALLSETALRQHLRRHQPEKIVLAQPNSFFETDAIEKLGRKLRILIELVPTTQFLLPREDFREWASGQRRLVMENHYRRMRKRFGWLMQPDGRLEGGAWNSIGKIARHSARGIAQVLHAQRLSRRKNRTR